MRSRSASTAGQAGQAALGVRRRHQDRQVATARPTLDHSPPPSHTHQQKVTATPCCVSLTGCHIHEVPLDEVGQHEPRRLHKAVKGGVVAAVRLHKRRRPRLACKPPPTGGSQSVSVRRGGGGEGLMPGAAVLEQAGRGRCVAQLGSWAGGAWTAGPEAGRQLAAGACLWTAAQSRGSSPPPVPACTGPPPCPPAPGERPACRPLA